MEDVNFDANATTAVSTEILRIRTYLENLYGLLNMSKTTDIRVQEMKRRLEIGENKMLNVLRLKNYTTLFTSGASESNSQIAKTLSQFSASDKRTKIIISSIEHKSMLMAIRSYFAEDDIIYIRPDIDTFRITLRGFNKAVKKAGGIDKVRGVIVMASNNETGVINEFGPIAKKCRNKSVWFHCDATQYIGKYVKFLSSCTSISASAHKFNGPKGKGFLFVHNSHVPNLSPLIFGTQQNHLRGGTIDHIGNCLAISALRLVHVNRQEKNRLMSTISAVIGRIYHTQFPARIHH